MTDAIDRNHGVGAAWDSIITSFFPDLFNISKQAVRLSPGTQSSLAKKSFGILSSDVLKF
jgi:hypothetical protein